MIDPHSLNFSDQYRKLKSSFRKSPYESALLVIVILLWGLMTFRFVFLMNFFAILISLIHLITAWIIAKDTILNLSDRPVQEDSILKLRTIKGALWIKPFEFHNHTNLHVLHY